MNRIEVRSEGVEEMLQLLPAPGAFDERSKERRAVAKPQLQLAVVPLLMLQVTPEFQLLLLLLQCRGANSHF
jgi:hypothetical protein